MKSYHLGKNKNLIKNGGHKLEDVDKLKTASIDCKKVSDAVDKNVVKKSKYNAGKQGSDKN